MTSRIAAVLLAVLAALFLTSCSEQASSDGHTDHQRSEEPTAGAQPAGFNADDVAFATHMIPHHEQAVEMSALVPDRSTNPQVVALAEQISAAQEPEIRAMNVFLVQWNENPGDSAGGGEHGGHGSMQGMVDDATMAKLESLKGPEFDTLWLQSMISHHQGAIEMAKAEIANGANEDAKRLAQTIVDTQQAEIGQMKQMLEGGQNG